MKRFTAILTAAVSALTLCSCSTPPSSEPLSMTGVFFDTIVSIDIWNGTQEILDHCEELCSTYEQMFSATIETSEISQINNAGGQAVDVSEETADLIRLGIKYGEISDGAFDITIAPASSLWNFTDNEEKVLPDKEKLAEAVSHIDYRCVEVTGTSVRLTDPEAQIDLGGIAKGYIADQLKQYLKSEGIEHALIDLGGNILTVGGRYDGTPFRIGLQKPFADNGTAIATLELTDQSAVSSGNSERYFEKDGIIYHHILDPDTGMPVQNNLFQVTIISDSSADGDALSTSCYALGLEKGMELIKSIEGTEAIFITDDYEIITTSDSLPISY